MKRKTPKAFRSAGGGRWTLGVRRFLHPRFPPCAAGRSALTVPNLMRSFLRRADLILATGSLAFFLSCEPHPPAQLHSAHHRPKAPAGDHHHAPTHASPSPAARSTP